MELYVDYIVLFAVLEVYQFARDAAVAESWLFAQEPYLISREYGRNLEETIKLIKKHEAFEKSAIAQEERFLALEKLTTVSFAGRGGGDMRRACKETLQRVGAMHVWRSRVQPCALCLPSLGLARALVSVMIHLAHSDINLVITSFPVLETVFAMQ